MFDWSYYTAIRMVVKMVALPIETEKLPAQNTKRFEGAAASRLVGLA